MSFYITIGEWVGFKIEGNKKIYRLVFGNVVFAVIFADIEILLMDLVERRKNENV